MRIVEQLVVAGASLGLATSGFASPPRQANMLWAEVCGRPDMRVAIPLGGDPQERERDCAGACHAALCRKTVDSLRKGDMRGAVV